MEEAFMKFLTLGFLLMLMGMFMIVSASLLSLIKAPEAPGAVSGALVVFIGPFPIGLGFGPLGPALILIGVLIAAAMAIMIFLLARLGR